MNDPDEFVRLIEGRACRALLVQEFWHHGVPVDPVNVLFLQVDGGRWARFFFDAGAFFWRAVAAPEAVTGGEPDWECRLVDAGARLGIVGQRIGRVTFTQPDPGCARLAMSLDRGRLVLDNAEDRSRLAFVEAVG